MARKANTVTLGLYPIKALPKGEYVRRVDICGWKGYVKEYGKT